MCTTDRPLQMRYLTVTYIFLTLYIRVLISARSTPFDPRPDEEVAVSKHEAEVGNVEMGDGFWHILFAYVYGAGSDRPTHAAQDPSSSARYWMHG